MKITWGRWVAASVVGCALIGVALLPPPDDSDADVYSRTGQIYNWGLARFKEASLLSWRAGARENHAHLLWRWRRYRLLQETARRVFAPGSGQHGATPAWFEPGVPEAQRRRVSELLAEEEAARGEWHGHAAIGVIVALDSSFIFGENELRLRGYSTQVMAPSPETGGRCIVIVRLGESAARGNTVLPDRARLTDACAFYDAFGAPGPQIASWLDSTRFAAARVLAITEPQDSAWMKRSRGTPWWYFDPYSARCAGGDQESCLRSMGFGTVGFDTPVAFRVRTFWDHGLPDLIVSSERYVSWSFSNYSDFDWSLAQLARDLGPARFARVWQSAKPLPEAYLDVAGEPLSLWIQRGIIAEHAGAAHAVGEDRRPFHIGAAPTGAATLITLLALATALALCARATPRPYAT